MRATININKSDTCLLSHICPMTFCEIIEDKNHQKVMRPGQIGFIRKDESEYTLFIIGGNCFAVTRIKISPFKMENIVVRPIRPGESFTVRIES